MNRPDAGPGQQPAGTDAECPVCDGTGDVPRASNPLTYRMCPACGGTGTSCGQQRPNERVGLDIPHPSRLPVAASRVGNAR